MLNTKLTPWPCFSEEESEKVSEVLLSNKVNYWTGNEGRAFEREFAGFADTEFAIAVSNGTLALDLALVALNIGSTNGGKATDEVIVTPRTFLASVSSIVNAGAVPVFADVDLESQNITVSTIDGVKTDNTKAVIAVHLAGLPCEMEDIVEYCNNFNIKVIEDCAQAHGAKVNGKSVGSFGDIGCWSFCQDKIMTTGGEGGMVTTNSKELWEKMWAYKDHGKSYEAIYNKEHPPGFRWVHESFGTNWRLTEMQSAIGRIQLTKMNLWNANRSRNAKELNEALSKFSCIRVPKVANHLHHAYYKFYAFVEIEKLNEGWTRDRIITELEKLGTPVFQGSCSEVYLEKAFEGTSYRPSKRLNNARKLGDTSLMFLVHPNLQLHEVTKMCDDIQTVLALANKR